MILIIRVHSSFIRKFKDAKGVIRIRISKKNKQHFNGLGARVMVLNVTFNNISVISWWSVLLVKKPEYPEKTTDISICKSLTNLMLYQIHLALNSQH